MGISRRQLGAGLTALVLVGTLGACSDDEADVVTGEPVSRPHGGDVSMAFEASAADAATAGGSMRAVAETVPPVVDRGLPGTNGFIPTAADAVSTFATDVDTASYTYARHQLNLDALPEPTTVRPEEFVNAFDQGYRPPADDGFSLSIDGAPTPFTQDGRHRLLRIGLQTRPIAAAERSEAALTFVIDVSGSMGEAGKLTLVKRSLHLLLDGLRPTDTVAVVTYSEQATTVLAPTKVSDRATISSAIDGLSPLNGTNVEAGVRLGYEVATAGFRAGAVNRVVVLSDGLANQGSRDPQAMVRTAGEGAGRGIQLITAGFGMGYGDALMEQLAQEGDGFAAFIDDEAEARRLLVDRLNATLQPRALDAKVQVTFEPGAVKRYRLVGYENRAVADDDFRKDDVDGGEIGAGHQVTALYEVELAREEPAGPLASVTLRWLDPTDRKATEASARVTAAQLADAFTSAPARFRLAAVAAAFAEVLRDSEHARKVKLADVARAADDVSGDLPGDAAVAELAKLVRKADALSPR